VAEDAERGRDATPQGRADEEDVVGREGILLYLIVLIAVILGVDYRFLRRDATRRLVVNVVIVLAFAAFYLAFLYHP
jgi:hypothetical protein